MWFHKKNVYLQTLYLIIPNYPTLYYNHAILTKLEISDHTRRPLGAWRRARLLVFVFSPSPSTRRGVKNAPKQDHQGVDTSRCISTPAPSKHKEKRSAERGLRFWGRSCCSWVWSANYENTIGPIVKLMRPSGTLMKPFETRMWTAHWPIADRGEE